MYLLKKRLKEVYPLGGVMSRNAAVNGDYVEADVALGVRQRLHGQVTQVGGSADIDSVLLSQHVSDRSMNCHQTHVRTVALPSLGLHFLQ